MEQWIDIAGKFGIPVALLMLLGYFLLKHVWPFVTKQIEDAKSERKADMEAAKSERKEEIGKFMDTLRARDVMIAEISQRHVKALESLTIEIRRGNGKTARKK
jgi:hypothetical protein